jgi:DNA-3-methyladenine glycosylase
LASAPAHNGLSLLASPFELQVAPPGIDVATGLRVGITKAAEQPWRFGLAGSPYLSRKM